MQNCSGQCLLEDRAWYSIQEVIIIDTTSILWTRNKNGTLRGERRALIQQGLQDVIYSLIEQHVA